MTINNKKTGIGGENEKECTANELFPNSHCDQ